MLKSERFDGYWQKGRPYLDGMETHYIKDKMTQVASLRAGEAHALWEAPIEKALELKKEGFSLIHFPSGMRALTSDSANPESIFADQRIRAAIEYAINRKEITDGLGHGFWEPVNQYSSSKGIGYNPDLIGRPYNVAKAKQLLAEAGYPKGFKTKIIASATTEGRDVVAAIQRDLLKVGIDAEIVFQDSGKYFLTIIKGWKNALVVFGQNAPLNPTQNIFNLYKTGRSRFPNLYRPIELKETLAKTVATPDFSEHNTLLKKAVRVMSDKAVVIPLWSFPDIYALHKSVRDPGFNGGRRGQWAPEGCWLSE
jgi:peptide/nickel transport system substrate-binding protein